MKRVAVLRGGPSEEYAISIQSGGKVLNALSQLDYSYKDIIISKGGEWLESGFVRRPDEALEGIDVVFVALHGAYGEDGQVQKILDRKKVPFTGSRSLPSAIAFNKDLTKHTLRSHKINMPKHRRFSRLDLPTLDESEIQLLFTEIGNELFVKPVSGGSSIGARYVAKPEDLKEAITQLLQIYEQIVIEEFIRGREATVGVLGNFRDTEIYTLPIVEIVPPDGDSVFSHEHKYSGRTQKIIPARFSYHEKAQLTEMAELAHKVIGCDQYSRSDFMVRDGQVYFLEINTLPGLTEESLFPLATAAVGLEYPQLIEHLIETATV